ncbi:hypothetical protein U732_2076 [Clostridium argentinense CDC 2741]|uniref:Uncharacterized protein n=1 Tax=Clostridium argentinense CDC 2741 TaxID=1418104 RepID=A0A0C1U4J0_9CLOT|nr:hypothetical protein [Clostridium argentinense]ARC85732.1 hypothetical protein RSJ17_15150 [Clostridium argentinense]KIE46473.1 hypothetical protein U732_2076 [Clostridium argentinense CDC 2741]NFF39811.1 hypothetical protein [Clostridium argentinense]NFP51086.1 hypothetical protein [Clostridium argentinense]NFP73218.1 hypothetical protein [Clostridium argentinense]
MLTLLLKILGIIALFTFLLLGIWSFVIFNQFFHQTRYRNYLLEKLSHNIYRLTKAIENNDVVVNYNQGDETSEDEILEKKNLCENISKESI